MKLNKQKLDLAMVNACMNAYDVCKAAEIQYPTFRRIINGKPCKHATAGKIAAALGVRAEDLIEWESEEA